MTAYCGCWEGNHNINVEDVVIEYLENPHVISRWESCKSNHDDGMSYFFTKDIKRFWQLTLKCPPVVAGEFAKRLPDDAITDEVLNSLHN